MSTPRGRVLVTLGALVVGLGLSGCGGTSQAAAGKPPASVRLGYFPNLTHATPIVADQEGLFAKHLGGTSLKVSHFNAGPAAVEALKSGAIDATYLGPGPATNAFINSGGKALTVVAGAASGGTSLVVNPSITSVQALKGQRVSTPQLGNTQDIALRYKLKQEGLTTNLQGGGDVSIVPQDNAQILDAFKQKKIAGAWVPEPWATRLEDAGGKVLIDERDLWPDKKFAITLLAVRTSFLKEHPDTVKALLSGALDAGDLIAKNPKKAQQDVADVIGKATGKPQKVDVIARAWNKLDFGYDPVPASITTGADHAYEVGVLKKKPELKGLIDLSILNDLLKQRGKPQISG
ncbi:ABC transporter substrate-binding protein [Luteipulveratus sp. YIM 133132]|uniref:ABC transporter substrate-binding protein n=1 Tax=Luteipulveratus flavus TaxID=3031728 RepID=A0ABT6C2E1_9MICO|nr:MULTISPECIES: ABC transporter substrate-binding protein [unclassified Luteipulveratus]MDE9364680.1 ABC transporter substrate-binding protein [Luteipulveratus sp. YIM 133132]MDF8262840.1 ABC transporter substrate-binding protein [Luteipulveratus sp. YIM 133296]